MMNKLFYLLLPVSLLSSSALANPPAHFHHGVRLNVMDIMVNCDTDKNMVLDLASGTLDVALAINKIHPNLKIAAMDFCAPMLQLGQKKLLTAQNKTIFPIVADAKKLPLPDECCDCITIAFGIRNILPRQAAFAEMLRVLVPGGRVCILEFGSGQERIWGGLYNFYLNHLLPNIAKLFAKDKFAYKYLADTICSFPTAKVFEKEMQEAGFIKTSFRKMTSGIVCLHIGEKACF
ncbi:MAG: ubiquinone/menaquinone biosynthesis methyltransferase [Desulfovibrio sp.]|nr:ubiquinone/menaquinone biosynthesis methyltransferase [Desulfovibrio sp.]